MRIVHDIELIFLRKFISLNDLIISIELPFL